MPRGTGKEHGCRRLGTHQDAPATRRGFSDNNYWSSSENDDNNAWNQNFNNGNQNNNNRNNENRVRPVGVLDWPVRRVLLVSSSLIKD